MTRVSAVKQRRSVPLRFANWRCVYGTRTQYNDWQQSRSEVGTDGENRCLVHHSAWRDCFWQSRLHYQRSLRQPGDQQCSVFIPQGVGWGGQLRLWLCVCMSVCPRSKRKTAWAITTKFGTDVVHYTRCTTCIMKMYYVLWNKFVCCELCVTLS